MNNQVAYVASNSQKNENTDTNIPEVADSIESKPKAHKFGQVDSKKLLSRLYSTPFQNPVPAGEQMYVLDMSGKSVNKPRIRKLEALPKPVEPVVRFKAN